MSSACWHNQELQSLWSSHADLRGCLRAVESALHAHETLTMRPLPSGLFPAVGDVGHAPESGYGNVWIRDNVYIARAYARGGACDVAARTGTALFQLLHTQRTRFEAIIADPARASDAMQRPHVRFDGLTLRELPERWPHAQNDALGYALWLYAGLADAGALEVSAEAGRVLQLLPAYFHAIRFWEDQDSGHWEETPKVSASSIGVVVAGLKALLALANGPEPRCYLKPALVGMVAELVEEGSRALRNVLPSECIERLPGLNRRYDAALLFLVHPLDVVTGADAALVVEDIERFLRGEVGVRRYLGDSYWAPDYDVRVAPGEQSADYSQCQQARDALLDSIGHEAQWCIFDSVLSSHFGERYLQTRDPRDLQQQTLYFERALAQITPEWECVELYFLKEGHYLPNPHRPLLWAQANLWAALEVLRASLVENEREGGQP